MRVPQPDGTFNPTGGSTYRGTDASTGDKMKHKRRRRSFSGKVVRGFKTIRDEIKKLDDCRKLVEKYSRSPIPNRRSR